MSQRAKIAAGTDFVPDTTDWWGDFDETMPPPRLAKEYRVQPKRKMNASTLLCAFLTLVVFIGCACFRLYDLSVINSKSREITSLNNRISDLNSTIENYEVRIGLQNNIERVRDVATNELGMEEAYTSNIVQIALEGSDSSAVTANAEP